MCKFWGNWDNGKIPRGSLHSGTMISPGCLPCQGPESLPCPPCKGWHPQTPAGARCTSTGSFQLCKEGKGLPGTEATTKCEGGQATQLPAQATACYFNTPKQPELVNVSPARAQNLISNPLPAPSTGTLVPVPPATSQETQNL